MIRFRHSRDSVTLKLGERWAAQAKNENYRDTASEKLWGIIKDIKDGRPWREVVAARYAQANPWLHRIVTSEARALFFRQNPPAAGSAVLDIGAGWGQIALPLAREREAIVTALEPTPERLAFIQAAAVQDGLAGRMHFVEADFLDLEFEPAFDLISCIGVLEWVPKFRLGEPRELQVEFMRRIRLALKPGGKCYVGIENRLGLKYLLGGRDDHTGQRNINVFDRSLAAVKHRAATGAELRVFTYSQAEYAELFLDAGFKRMETYGALPDYKLPEIILPWNRPAEFNQTLLSAAIPEDHDGCDGSALAEREELVSHYRSFARMGIAHHFSPSFFFILQ